jgi:hypothetical protein
MFPTNPGNNPRLFYNTHINVILSQTTLSNLHFPKLAGLDVKLYPNIYVITASLEKAKITIVRVNFKYFEIY